MHISVHFLNTFEGCSFRVECSWKHGYGNGKGFLPVGIGNYFENTVCVAPALPYSVGKEQGFGVGYFKNEPDNELTGFGNPTNVETPSEV